METEKNSNGARDKQVHEGFIMTVHANQDLKNVIQDFWRKIVFEFGSGN